jgi:hypothetical protein
MSGSGIILQPRYDHESKSLIIGQWQDVEDIIEMNKRLANEPKPKSDWGQHYATIPHNIRFKWWIEETGGNPDMPIFSARFENEIVAKKLEDPEWRALRVDLGCAFQLGWTSDRTR